MRGTCRHDEAATSRGGEVPLEADRTETGVTADVRPFEGSSRKSALAGFLRIDVKPPRA
jgi:hypothetical protein